MGSAAPWTEWFQRRCQMQRRIGLRVACIRTWPAAEQASWRSLLDTDPRAAILIAELAYRLDARPVGEQLELELAA